MYCPECGTKNEDGARFCEECGTRLEDLENVTPQGEELAAEPWAAQGEEPAAEPWADSMGGPVPGAQNGYGQFSGAQNGHGEFSRGKNGYGQFSGAQPAAGRKKPVSKMAVVLAAELLLAAALAAGIVCGGGKKYSPEATAMEYWEAVMAHEWSEAYERCLFPQSEMLVKQMYVNANSSAPAEETVNYTSARVIKPEDMAARQLGGLAELFGADADGLADRVKSGLEDPDVKNYVVEYLEEGTAEKQYAYITLTRTGKKKFFFWDDWKVTSSDGWVKDVVFSIPENAGMSLNGVPVDSSAAMAEDGRLQIRIPYMFVGTYQLTVEAEGMETYRKLVTVDSAGPDTGYIELVPSGEVLAALGEQAGSDVCRIMESALEGRGFDAVQGLFSREALDAGNLEWAYTELQEYLAEAEIAELKISGITASLEDYPSETRISFMLSANRSETRPSYGGEAETITDPLSMPAGYVKEENGWKLTGFPVNMYDF